MKCICRLVLPVLLAVLLLPAAALAETRVMVISDPHYMAPSLYQDSSLFITAMEHDDGKVSQYSEELLAGLYQEILAQKPDALVVSGDLTLNGEKASHTALAAWFASVEEAGVPVWIIPGNHDINSSAPMGFSGDSAYQTDGVTPEEFAEIYADFMETDAPAGFSYTVALGDSLLLAMIDESQYIPRAESGGNFTNQHSDWLTGVLKAAGDAEVVTVTHHSLLSHAKSAGNALRMGGYAKLETLCVRYGVHLNLSGHLHVQHIARENDLADAALGAFCIWPHRYAMVSFDGSLLTYEAKSLDDAYLPEGFSETTQKFFSDRIKERAISPNMTGTEDEINGMAEYAARINLAYCAGTFDPSDASWKEDPAYTHWMQQTGSSLWDYMQSILDEDPSDNLLFRYSVDARLEEAPY